MKQIITLILLVVVLTACSPVPTISPTLVPTSTATPTQSPIPTLTMTPLPTIEVNGVSLPDPQFTNPELFDLNDSNAPIPRFVIAMITAGLQISKEQVATSLQYQQFKDINGAPFYVAVYHLDPDPERQGEDMEDNFPILIATNKNDQWTWSELTLNTASNLRSMKFGALLNLSAAEQEVVSSQLGSGFTFIGWEYTHPSANKYDWQELSYSIRFSNEHKLNIIAGPLVWGQSMPDWVEQTADSPEKLREIMLSHIEVAVSRHRGRVDYWEVVNESNHLGRDIFWGNLGSSYISDAFARARTTDPEAKLLYNDYIDLYDTGGIDRDKRIGVIEQVVTLLAEDGNIDAIGIQIDGNIDTINLTRLEEGLERLNRFGLPIIITEFSLRIDGLNTSENLFKQSEVAGDVMHVLQNCGCVIEIDQWGLRDDLTNTIYGKTTNAGLYYEQNGQLIPKPIVYGIIASFVFPPSE